MTVRSATIGSDWFLNGLAELQARELKTQKVLSSGTRVSTAADDPAAAGQSFAGQVLTLEQQMAALADTQVGGRYIFGGDADETAPYQYNAASTNGVDAAGPAVSTRSIVNPDGVTVFQPLTAAGIFDSPSGNAFGALKSLADALAANDPAAVGSALSSLGDVSDLLNRQQVYYGAAGDRISAEQTAVGGRM